MRARPAASAPGPAPATRAVRRVTWRGAALAALAAAVVIHPAHAQERARSGFWLDAGAGYGRLRLRCTNCGGAGTARGGTLTATLGRSLSQRASLGLEAQVWSSWESGPREQVRSVTVVAQWYPFRGEHFFMRGGTGVVWGPVVQGASGTQPESVKGTGVGLTFGVGYDVRLGEHIAVAFQAASHVAALGDLDLRGTTLQDTIAYVTRLALAFVYR